VSSPFVGVEDLFAGFEIFLVAGGAVRHMLPSLIALERLQLGGPSGKLQKNLATGAAFAIRVGIRRENGLLDLFLDTVPLLFRGFFHVLTQSIMVPCRRSRNRFSVA